MARRTQTYAIRLAVEGGGQVKAELVSVGQSGEQSLKRIESAGDRASGGLKGLGRQAELLRTGIRTLGGALAGVATVGGLAALVDRSISAADAIGKTADKIGVGVEALQELRFAAKASGVEQQTLDMALQRFTRRAAEAAQGTGEAKDALAQMGIALRDQSGNLRSSEDLLADVADAFARIEDPAERLRLAFKLFDSEGVALGQPAPRRQRCARGDARARSRPRHRPGRAPGARCRASPHRARHARSGDLGQPDPGRARGGAGDRRPLQLARRCRRQGRASPGSACSMRPRRRASARSATSSIWPARRSRSWRGGSRSCASPRRSASRPSSTPRRSTRWRPSSTSCRGPAIRPRPGSHSWKGRPTPSRRLRYQRPLLTTPQACRTGRRTWSGSRASSRARCSVSRTRAASGSSPSMSAGSPRSRRSEQRTAATLSRSIS